MTINKFAVGTLGAVVFALALLFAVAPMFNVTPVAHAQEFEGFDEVGDCGDCGDGGYTYDDQGLNDCDAWGCDSDDFGCDDFGCDGDTGSDCNDFGCGGGYGGSSGSGCSSCGGGGGGFYGGGSWGGGVTVPRSQPSVTNVNNNYNTNQNQNVNNVNVTVGSTDDNNDDDHDYGHTDKKRKVLYHSPVVYNPPVYTPYVTLSQVPYTGLELGFWGTVAYWGFLVLWCLLAAYLIAVKKVHTRWANRIKLFLFGDESVVSHPAYMQVETPVFAAASAAVAPQIATLGEVPMHRKDAAVADENQDTTDPFILSQINRYN